MLLKFQDEKLLNFNDAYIDSALNSFSKLDAIIFWAKFSSLKFYPHTWLFILAWTGQKTGPGYYERNKSISGELRVRIKLLSSVTKHSLCDPWMHESISSAPRETLSANVRACKMSLSTLLLLRWKKKYDKFDSNVSDYRHFSSFTNYTEIVISTSSPGRKAPRWYFFGETFIPFSSVRRIYCLTNAPSSII